MICTQVDLLKGLKELVVNKQPDLIPTFLPEILELQVDPSPQVKRFLLEFLVAAIDVAPKASILIAGLQCIGLLLNEQGIPTVKRALSSAYPIFRASFVLVAVNGTQHSEELIELWQGALGLKNAIVSIFKASDGSEVIKLSCCRFIEQAAMLLSADVVPKLSGISSSPIVFPGENKIASRASIIQEGEGLIVTLSALIKDALIDDADKVSGEVTAAALKSVTLILHQRPTFSGRILPLLLNLAKSEKFKSLDKNEHLRKILVSGLQVASKSTHPMMMPWRKKLEAALSAMGENGIAKQSKDSENLRLAKRQKLGFESQTGVQHVSHTATETSSGEDFSFSDAKLLQQTDRVIKGLIVSKDAATLAPFVLALQPELLADLVLGYLANLPPRHTLLADNVPYEPWIETFCGRLKEAADRTRVSTESKAEALQSTKEYSNLLDLKKEDKIHRQDNGEPKTVKGIEEDEAAPSYESEVPLLKESMAFHLIPEDILAPKDLTENQKQVMRRDAIVRILRTEKTSAKYLRSALIARLATLAPDTDGLVNVILDYLMNDFHGKNGMQIVDRLLLSLFAECSDSFSDSDISNELAGSRYEDVLLSILESIRDSLPASDSTMVDILLDAPALPMPSIRNFLLDLCKSSSDRATQALVAVRDLTLSRPPNRMEFLSVALEASISDTQELRNKSIKLLVNRLFMEPLLTEIIQSFAREQMQKLCPHGETEASKKELSDADAFRFCTLFCALCTKNPSLLEELFETFGKAVPTGKSAILLNAQGLAKTLGPQASALINVIKDPPDGSVELVLQMLEVLTESRVPPKVLVNACLELFEKLKDARLLPILLPGANKTTALNYLPPLIGLPQDELKQAFARLVKPLAQSSENPIFAPVELLTALHTLDFTKDSRLLKNAISAISICINSPNLFPPETLAASINQLLTRVPLPQLFMRTVIQSFSVAPRLKPFTVNVLSQLASKQVWNDKTQWRGWIMAAQQTAPDSFPVWLQLPAKVLDDVLGTVTQACRDQLVQYSLSKDCKINYPSATKEVVMKYSMKVQS